MKKVLLSVIAICLFLNYPLQGKKTGSPGGKTGSPMDGDNCTKCHNGTINSGSGILSVDINIPAQGYTAGQTYSITIQMSQSPINNFGFEITCEETGNTNKIGTFLLTDQANTKFVNNNTAITHTQNGTLGTNMKIWTMDWIAPSNATNGVTFYVSALAANGNNNDNGDFTYTTSRSFSEATNNITDIKNNITALVSPDYQSILINSNQNKKVDIKIYKLSGKLIKIEDAFYIPNKLDINGFESGIYLLQIDNQDGNNWVQKIVIP